MSTRRYRIRFGDAPGEEARARFDAALAASSAAPRLCWEGNRLQVEYLFPALGFEEIWNALVAAGLDRSLRRSARWLCAARALLEHNERAHLGRPAGWRRHVDRLHLVSAGEPAAPATRGGLWRKHERSG